MIDRCHNKNHISYGRYGALGKSVCEERRNSFEEFKEWAHKNGYIEGLSLDRINNNFGYKQDNCRWIERNKQSDNKRKSIKINYLDEVKTIKEWSLDIRCKSTRNKLYIRLKRGWGFQRAFETPKL